MIRSLLHIPCKISSKRIGMKNVMPVADKPAFYWPIAAALEAGAFDKIVVSSDQPPMIHMFKRDCPALKSIDIVEQHPNTVLSTTQDVAGYYGAENATVSIAQATAVLINAEDITGALELSSETLDPVVLANRTHEPDWVFGLRDDGKLARPNMWGRWLLRRFTPAGPYGVDAGEFYTVPPGRIMHMRDLLLAEDGWRYKLVPRSRAVDIDYPDQLEHAIRLFDYRRAPGVKPYTGNVLAASPST